MNLTQVLSHIARAIIILLAPIMILSGCAVLPPVVDANDGGGSPVVVAEAPVAEAPVAEATPSPPGPERLVATETQLSMTLAPTRDLRDLALRLDPDVDEIPVVAVEVPRAYAVGDQVAFSAHNVDNNENFQVTAELVHMTDHVYAWVEVGQEYDHDQLAAAIDRFSAQSYDAERAFFGSEWSPGIDSDPRLHVLHANNLGRGIAGYYSSADEYSTLARPFSNEKEMFYINLSWLNAAQDYVYYETVLAHEFQHMIHWHNDRNEETWLNEGLSEFAQEVAGYDPDTIFSRTFAQTPDTQLNTWNDTSNSNAEHYGSAYLFVSYFTQRFGPEMTRALVAHPANGVIGVDAVLAENGYAETFTDVFADWVIANFVDDPDALGQDGLYGYRTLAQPEPLIERTIGLFARQPYASTVNNYAADYIRLDRRGDVTVDFEGQTLTRLADTTAFSGQLAWWSNRGDDTDTRLTRRFDLRDVAPGTPVAMDVAMWWDIEVDYDYGYVLASRDGRKWTILPGARTTTDNPSGNSFGPGFTGRSSQDKADESVWLTERFDLSDFAGEEVLVRFEYVTDDAVTASGWFIDDIRIPAIDYAVDFENGMDGWESEGWLLTDNQLPQRWLFQVMEFDDDQLVAVTDVPVGERGQVSVQISDLGRGRSAVLAVSAIAPITTEPAAYSISVE